MKVLIPQHIKKEFIDRMKEASPDVTVELLGAHKHVPLVLRFLHPLAFRLPFYRLYRFIHKITEKRIRYVFSVDGKKCSGIVSDAEVFLVTWVFDQRMLEQLIPSLPKLKWIYSTTTGTEQLGPILSGTDIVLTNIGDLHSERVAEFTLGLILAVSKNIDRHIALMRSRKWKTLPAKMIKGTTVGIIGLGNIGAKVACLSKKVGMRVVAADILKKENENVDINLLMNDIVVLLRESDYVVVCCPLTNNTKGLIGETQLKSMKNDAYLINIARGELVKKEDIIKALNNGWIAGACLDVFPEEPLHRADPFYYVKNILITHHSAFSTAGASTQVMNAFIKSFGEYVAGCKSKADGVENISKG